MRPIHYIYSLIMILLLPLAGYARDGQKKPEKIRVISYNIWNGFEQNAGRRERFVNWVKEQNPDILALTELVGFTAKDLADLAASYGHPYSAIVKEKGYPVGVTSRQPITVVTRMEEGGLWHGMLHVQTYDMDVIVTHLSPFDWKYRLNEARIITDYIAGKKLDKYMIMGDFNAYTPFDADEVETHTTLINQMREWDSKQKDYRNMRDGRFDYSVLSLFLSTGLADVCRLYVPVDKRTTFPAAYLYEWQHGDTRLKMLGERLDYILVSPTLLPRCVNAAIHNGQATEGISDHYPVSIDMTR